LIDTARGSESLRILQGKSEPIPVVPSFDDQESHCKNAAQVVSTAKVLIPEAIIGDFSSTEELTSWVMWNISWCLSRT
jgi:hypothetical protein